MPRENKTWVSFLIFFLVCQAQKLDLSYFLMRRILAGGIFWLLLSSSAQNYLELGEEFMNLHNWRVALTYFERALEIEPDLASAWFGKGLCYCQLGKYEEGLKALDQALARAPKNKDYLYVKGVCLEWRGEPYYKEAELYYQRAMAVAPENAQLHHKLGTLYQRQGRFQEAIEEFQQALKLDPSYYVSYNNLANCYVRLNHPEKAIELYQKAIALCPNPSDYHFYYQLGLAYLLLNRPKEAKASFLIETALNPDFIEPHLNLGNLYLLEQDFERALEEYQEVLAIAPDNPQAHYNLGQLYLLLNMPGSALKHFQKYVELNPENGEAHYLLGFCYSKIGDKKRAWQEYIKSLKLGYHPTKIKRK